jgi:hypothetical protein
VETKVFNKGDFMKLPWIYLVSASVVFFTCNLSMFPTSSKKNDEPVTVRRYHLSGTVNGTSVSGAANAELIPYSTASGEAGDEFKVEIVDASSNAHLLVDIYFPGGLSASPRPFNQIGYGSTAGYCIPTPTFSCYYSTTTGGNITISSFDKQTFNIVGTFSCAVGSPPSYTITNGSFSPE